jgi:protein-S-isoprenylcysteine O-methyltransferase Ste14
MKDYWMADPFHFLILCWCALAGVFLLRKRPPDAPEVRRDQRALIPIAVEALSFAIVWGVRRQQGQPLLSPELNTYFGFLACILAAGSVWLILSSVRSLGKQWTVAARLVEGHQLVIEGPYGVVRNPIYVGIFGMLIATGIARSRLSAIAIGAGLYLIGTLWRIRLEEHLLRDQFGPEFEQYCKRVRGSLFPRF